MNLLAAQRQEDLPRAAELAEPGEDQPDHFLGAEVGIEAETGFAMPEVADRHADAQFAAARFGAGGVEHARPQHAEFELADGALHAEQQSIVRPTGIVDAVQVDDARIDQAAELEQMVPVAAVAGQPRSVEAQHCPDFAGTQRCHQPLEAGPRHRPAGRAAEIVVDHFDLAETPAPRDVDELVLAPLALQVALDLRLGGLPDVDDRFALQHRGR